MRNIVATLPLTVCCGRTPFAELRGVCVQVVDRDGEPVAGIEVVLLAADFDPGDAALQRRRTDRLGIAVFDAPGRGEFRFIASSGVGDAPLACLRGDIDLGTEDLDEVVVIEVEPLTCGRG